MTPYAPAPTTAPQKPGLVRGLAWATLATSVILLLLRLLADGLSIAFASTFDASASYGSANAFTMISAICSFLAFLLSLVVLGLGIALTVTGTGRSRIGGILVLVSVPLAGLLGLILGVLVGGVTAMSTVNTSDPTGSLQGTIVAGGIASIVVALIAAALRIIGSMMALRHVSAR